ncbi:hypothetical protein QBC43DRAFT_288522 [Cladorrhinum sp. PSN259]|nr:hypothetical protein QBC43DRAFT_288522 [Cladorrhinum sp. PSN259]
MPLPNDLTDELVSILPNRSPVDPETSRLLQPPPARKRLEHHVRVQGRLALVKSVSTADLRSDATQIPTPPLSAGIGPPRIPLPQYEPAVGSAVAPTENWSGRRKSLESEGKPQNMRQVVPRDNQFRGYGIGGAGNIRRPIDVIHPPTSSSGRKWNLREIFGLPADPNAKSNRRADL